jgi:hypothetical protein
MKKTTTACCALCQINNVNNDTTIEELEYAIDILTNQKEKNTEVGITTGNGQTSVFVIVSPGEYVLSRNLKKLGFELKHTFERRKGYPPVGELEMYIKNL